MWVSVSACDCMLHSSVCQPCQECVSWDPIKTCWVKGKGGAGAEKCESRSGRRGDDLHDPGKGCCYCLSPLPPRGQRLVQSCKGTTAQMLSICTRCGTFPHRGFDSNTNLIRQRAPFPTAELCWGADKQQPTKTGYRKCNVEQRHESWMAAQLNQLIFNQTLEENLRQDHKHLIDLWTWMPGSCHRNRRMQIYGHIFF